MIHFNPYRYGSGNFRVNKFERSREFIVYLVPFGRRIFSEDNLRVFSKLGTV